MDGRSIVDRKFGTVRYVTRGDQAVALENAVRRASFRFIHHQGNGEALTSYPLVRVVGRVAVHCPSLFHFATVRVDMSHF